MLPHHLSIKVPHAQVKVLIHNPDPPQDLAAFSEHRSAGKGDPDGVNVTGKIANDSNNNNGSLPRGNAQSRADSSIHLPASQVLASKKRVSDKSADKAGGGGGGSKSEASKRKEASDSKKKETENKKKEGELGKRKDSTDSKKKDSEGSRKKDGESGKKKDSDGSSSGKGVKNGDNAKRKEGDKASAKKDGEGPKKKDNAGVGASKCKDSKDSKDKPPKKKSEKKKKAGDSVSEEKVPAETKEESVPEHGWVWVGDPQNKKVVSVVSLISFICYLLLTNKMSDNVILVLTE